MATARWRQACHGPPGFSFYLERAPVKCPASEAKVPLNTHVTMTHSIESLSLLRLLVVSLVGFLLGGLWYSPVLFVKAWLKEMKITPEMMEAYRKGGMAKLSLPACYALTIVSTFTLAAIEASDGTKGFLKGTEMGLFVGLGLIASRSAVNGMFEHRTMRHMLITTGHDVVLCALVGGILGVWR
jgi:hypothetical protein